MSRNISISIRLSVAALALVGVNACQEQSPVQPTSPNNQVGASAPSAIKIKPQFYFNGILFTGTHDAPSGELYSMNPDGSNVTRLTFDDTSDVAADVSPTGPSFIWVRRANGSLQGEFYTQNLDGTNRKQLTNFGAIISYPHYSPDGSKIVFAKWLSTGPEIFVMNAAGNNVKQLTSLKARASWPSWSPDGSKIAFQADNAAGVNSIWTMNADGSGQTMILSCAYPGCVRPKWSPVANEIAAERVDIAGIFVMDATTGVQTGYIPNPDHDMQPTWSKDGIKIIFQSQRSQNGGLDLFATIPVRGPVTAPPPVERLTSFIGNEVGAAYSR
jgi:TolB protein